MVCGAVRILHSPAPLSTLSIPPSLPLPPPLSLPPHINLVVCCAAAPLLQPFNTAAPPVQHSPGAVSLRVNTPQKIVLQEREQRGGSAAAFYQVLHGGALLQHGYPTTREINFHHKEGKETSLKSG